MCFGARVGRPEASCIVIPRSRPFFQLYDYQAILVKGHRPNHLLHLVLTIVTLGVWGIVWLGVIAFGGEKRMSASVDEWGNTNIQNL